MKNVKKTVLLFVFGISGFLASAQTYQQGVALGQGDAQETMNLHFRLSRCATNNGGPGSPITYESCYVLITSEQTFINFWQDYLTHTKNDYCNATTNNMKKYYKGQVEGYHAKMIQLSNQYGANYYGNDSISCN